MAGIIVFEGNPDVFIVEDVAQPTLITNENAGSFSVVIPSGVGPSSQQVIDSIKVINGTNLTQQERDDYAAAGVLVLRLAP